MGTGGSCWNATRLRGAGESGVVSATGSDTTAMGSGVDEGVISVRIGAVAAGCAADSGRILGATVTVRSSGSSPAVRSSVFESEIPYAYVDLNSNMCAGSTGWFFARSFKCDLHCAVIGTALIILRGTMRL